MSRSIPITDDSAIVSIIFGRSLSDSNVMGFKSTTRSISVGCISSLIKHLHERLSISLVHLMGICHDWLLVYRVV